MPIDMDKEILAAEMKGSLLRFCQYFYPLLYGRDFIIPNPMCRESHVITICRGLTRAFRLEIPTHKLLISVPPGHGKSTMLLMWVAWAMAQYPDSKFLYISYSLSLAAKHTETIRRIIQLPHYKYLFDVEIRHDARGKEFFQTTDGGAVAAFGSMGSIVGCFPPDELVRTSEGDFKISEIVNNKMELSVFSYNTEERRIELKPISGWFKNPENSIIEVKFSDGSSIRCTPDHKILTDNRGWVHACNLLTTDTLLSPADYNASANAQELSGYALGNGSVMQNAELRFAQSIVDWNGFWLFNAKEFFSTIFNNASTDTKFDLKFTRRYRQITNSLKLFISKFFVFKFAPMLGSFAFSVPGANSSGPNIHDGAPAYAVYFCNIIRFFPLMSMLTNFQDHFFVKLSKTTHCSMRNCILDVFRSCSIRKIAEVIIKRVSVKMSDIIPMRSWPNECFAHEAMNGSFFSSFLEPNGDNFVSSGANPRLKNFLTVRNVQSIAIGNNSIVTSNDSVAGYAIASIGPRYKSPVSINFIGHEKITYCLEVEDNHNFIITGRGGATIVSNCDGGLPGLDRFSGAVILDDMLKVDEAHSETIRNSVILNYRETIQQRARGINVPFISIGQRVHEADLSAYLLSGADGYDWEHIMLQSIDEAGNALYPEAFPLEMLKIKEEMDPYVFSAQMQQLPVPAGGSLFKPEWFVILDEEPEILMTFITADTAETNKSYNDATVFSFWGLYEIEAFGKKTGELGLHWLDCLETRIEPKDLKDCFMDFYSSCCQHSKPPLIAVIEKKSTGVTLVSVLDEIRGISIRAVERNRASGSKTQRFLEMQPHVAAKKVSFTFGSRHQEMCISHMSKVTANDSHRFDDICDTAADAIRLAFIEKTLYSINTVDKNREQITQQMSAQFNKRVRAGAVRNDRIG